MDWAVVPIQQFINKRNVKYRPYGPWGHFPKEIKICNEVCSAYLVNLSMQPNIAELDTLCFF